MTRTGETSRSLQRAFVALLVLLLPALAGANVELSNTVQKVVAVTGADGQVETRLEPADEVVPGDTLRYTISFANTGVEPVDAGSIVITNPIPPQTSYLDGTAFGSGTVITFSVDGGETFGGAGELSVTGADGSRRPAAAADYTTLRWVFEPALAPGETGRVSFQVRLD